MSVAPAVTAVVYCDGEDAGAVRTLEALSRQTLAGIEIVLVGAAPGEESLLRDVPGLVDRAVHRLANVIGTRPLTAADRNVAVIDARAAYVLELFAGDEPALTMLEKCSWALRTRPDAAIALVGADRPVDTADANGDLRIERRGSTLDEVVTGAYVFRRSAWDLQGRFDEEAPAGAVDRDLCLRLLERGWIVTRVVDDLARLGTEGPAKAAPELAGAADRWLASRHEASFHRATAARRRRAAWDGIAGRSRLLGGISRRVDAKVEAESLWRFGGMMRRPGHTLMRLLPGRLKGRWWDRRGLPRPDVDMWEEIPVLRDLPDGPDLAVVGPADDGDGRTRVLILHPYLVAGGAETVILNLLTYIDRERFDAHLVTTEGGQNTPAWMHDPWLDKFAAQVPSIFRMPSFLERAYFLRFLVDFVESRRIDVLLISISVFGYRALSELRARRPDMAVVDLLHAEGPYARIDQITVASWYRELLDLRVVTTETVRSVQVSKYGESPERIRVIPNGVDTQVALDPARHPRGSFRQTIGVGDDVAMVLFFGRIADEKQPLHIVEVAELLRARDDIRFVVIGDGPEKPELLEVVSERDLGNLIILPPQEDVVAAIADADLVLFPSKREGLPMSGIEAMAMAKPVVASRVPGWSDLVEDGKDGFLVEDGDFHGYARAIARLVDEPELRARMSEAGRTKALASYDVRACVRQWERAFMDAKAGHRS